MKPAPCGTVAQGWMARGVQHELLLRMLRSLRHDLLAPLSVARLSASMAKRRLSGDAVDAPAALQRLVELESHLADLAESLRELRHWDQDPGAPLGIGQALTLCSGWFRAPLAMRGFTLAEPEAAQPASVAPGTAPQLPRHDLIYVTAGLLAHVQDCWAPCALQLRMGSGASPSIEVAGTEAPVSAAALEAAAALKPAGAVIDLGALQSMLPALGWSLETPGPLRLTARRLD